MKTKQEHFADEIFGMSYDGRVIANIALDEADELGIELSNLSLQKVLYFCHAWHLVETGEPLIKNQFEAWQHGPVLQFLYRQFKIFGNSPINSRATRLNPQTGEQVVAIGEIGEETRTRIRNVVNFYGRLEPWDLVDLSHQKGSPWDLVWNSGDKINPGMKITHDSVREYYSKATFGRSIQ